MSEQCIVSAGNPPGSTPGIVVPRAEPGVAHSPGPWLALGPGLVVDANNVGVVLTAGENGMSDEQNGANARLVAAAPELLRALEDLTDAYTLLAESGDFFSEWTAEGESEVVNARAAIAKATLS